MIDQLIKYFENHTKLNEREKSFIKENIRVEVVQKNHLLLSEGEVSKAFYFILEGAMRLFYKINL